MTNIELQEVSVPTVELGKPLEQCAEDLGSASLQLLAMSESVSDTNTIVRNGADNDSARASRRSRRINYNPLESAITLDTDDSVALYLHEIGKIPLLNKEQEVELSKRVRAGLEAKALLLAEENESKRAALIRVIADGKQAQDDFVLANLRLGFTFAKRYTGKGVEFKDLIQEANISLIRSVQKFDYRKGFKFSTYAAFWLRQSLNRAVGNTARTIRVPIHALGTKKSIDAAATRLLVILGREPTHEELSLETGHDLETIETMKRIIPDAISLSTPRGEEGDMELTDTIPDTSNQYQFEVTEGPRTVLEFGATLEAILGVRDAGIVMTRMGFGANEPQTLRATGEAFNLTYESIRRIEAKSFHILGHPIHAEALRPFLVFIQQHRRLED